MSGGQHRDDEVTRTESAGWTRTRELRRSARPRETTGCTTVGVCAKGIKKELNTLDEADFVRDVEKSASHQQSQIEIGGDNPCSRHFTKTSLATDSNSFPYCNLAYSTLASSRTRVWGRFLQISGGINCGSP